MFTREGERVYLKPNTHRRRRRDSTRQLRRIGHYSNVYETAARPDNVEWLRADRLSEAVHRGSLGSS